MNKVLVVLSGGQDSTTCLFWALSRYQHVEAVTFNYNQRHSIEIACATKIAEYAKEYGLRRHSVMDISSIALEGTSPLTNKELDVESYKDAASLPGGLEKTFVPGRNIIFTAIASNLVVARSLDAMVVGVSEEDFGGYPDCRHEFISAMETAISAGMPNHVSILTPLIHLDKKATVEMSYELKGCWAAIGMSHTCYNGVAGGCGTCHSCLLRQKGFDLAGHQDPMKVGQ